MGDGVRRQYISKQKCDSAMLEISHRLNNGVMTLHLTIGLGQAVSYK